MARALHFNVVHRKLLAVLYALLLLSHSVTFVLCSSSKTSSSAHDLTNDILKGLEEAFKSDHDAYTRVLYSLVVGQQFIGVLQNVINNINAFKNVAQRMADVTKRPDEDPKYRQFMHDFWSNFLKENNSEHPDNGQRFDFSIPRENSYAVAEYAFMRSLARLPQESFEELLKFVKLNLIKFVGPIAKYVNRELISARSANAITRVSIVSGPLAYDVYVNIRRWWDGEITGKRCVKNILDKGVGMVFGIAGGVGGEIIGAWIGGFLGGPIGAIAGALTGAFLGGYSATTAATILFDKLTQWVFGLPKSEALENAYNFLGVSPTDSSSYINSCYHQLARKYHPDKGGDPDNWGKLLFYMAVIKVARL